MDNQWSGKLILRDYGDGEQAALRQGEPARGYGGARGGCATAGYGAER